MRCILGELCFFLSCPVDHRCGLCFRLSERRRGSEIHRGKYGAFFPIERHVVCISSYVFETMNVQNCMYYQ